MLSILWNLAAFIIALGVLITVHEFGHFWVARRCGVRVERFSIGFGKALWRRTDRYGTEYVIALIPLGGYVKMLDERAELVAPELRRHAFNNKTVGQRAAIIAAGPVANFIFAIFAYWLVFIIGVPGVRPVIGEITPNSIAAQAQIAPGTELKAVDGIETPDWDAVRLQLVSKIGDQQTTVSVAPFGSDQRQDKTLDLRHWAFEPDKQDPVSSLGIRPRGPQIEPVLSEVQANSAASKAGLQAGDRIVKVDGQPLTQWMKFVTFAHDFTVDQRNPFKAGQATARFLESDFHDHLIAWHHRTLKARFINTREIIQFARFQFTNAFKRQNTGCLRHRFQNQHAWQNRFARKVPLEKRLVDGDIFHRTQKTTFFKVQHAIDQ